MGRVCFQEASCHAALPVWAPSVVEVGAAIARETAIKSTHMIVRRAELWKGKRPRWCHTTAPKVFGISGERGMSGWGARAGNVGAICLSVWGGASMSPNRRPQDFFLELPLRGGCTPSPIESCIFFDRLRLTYSGLWSGELVVLLFLEF